MSCKKHLIVALDRISKPKALDLANQLAGSVWGFKVNDLLLTEGIAIVETLKKYGNVFADPKLHDIPNTVKNSIETLENAGADLITVHASGGRSMMQEAASTSKHSKILAVTALTSLADEETEGIYGLSAPETVKKFLLYAAQAGVDGIVCSPQELLLTNGITPKNFIRLTPGIRPQWHQASDDQNRTMTPLDAIKNGSSFIVVGRPILQHESPEKAVELINTSLKEY